MPAPNDVRTHTSKSASWSLLAAGFLSQACPSAAPLFHSCAMLVAMPKSLHRPKRQQDAAPLK